MFHRAALFTAFLFITTHAMAAVQSGYMDYTAPDGTAMRGYLAYDDAKTSPRPGVLIVHDWMGPSKFTEEKAQKLASAGYVAFAADIYSKGAQPKNPDEAKIISTKYKDDRSLMRAHTRAAYDRLASLPQVDKQKIAVMGYCFGGTAALELARSGAPLVGTASFHGGLSTPTPQDAKNIHGPVLAMHGADDPYVPPAEVQIFKEEMKNAGVALQFVSYPGAVHAFTNPAVGNDNSKGAAYNASADKASWNEFEKFLKTIF